MNDGGNRTCCDCEACTAFAQRTSWTDLHLDFVNEVADGVKADFPKVLSSRRPPALLA